jgi:hypothetical protein
MEVHSEKICLTGPDVLKAIPYNTLMSLVRRGQAERVRRACRDRQALYSVDGFRHNYRVLLYERHPDLSDFALREKMIEESNIVLDNILPDPAARNYFETWQTPSGKYLKPEDSVRYYNSAIILNAMRRAWDKMFSMRTRSGHKMMLKADFWGLMRDFLPVVCEKYENTLPGSARRLQEASERYFEPGVDGGNNYAALLKTGKIGNQNRVKITPRIERMLVSIYGSKEKPFLSEVPRIYERFLSGLAEIVDHETGEIYDRKSFYRNGEPVILSDAAVWRVLNKPVNRRVVDRLRNDFKHNQQYDVPVQRESPHYSLSKISLDDRDLCRKTTDGQWVHAYYAYDVASGCVIGAAWSLTKDTRLVEDCMRDMWKNLKQWNLATPYEAEVENHLMRELSDRLNNTFMHVTWCAAMNSREKRAEHFNKSKKWYGQESERSQGMAHGRHYAKHEAYLFSREKVFDETNHKYKPQLSPASFEQIVAEDRAQIELYNNARHTNPKRYKAFEGMTRMQVLVMRQHPSLAPLNWRVLCREWGYRTDTSLKSSNLVTVQYQEWALSSPDKLNLFQPNNYGCTAHWLPEADGSIQSVYIYQDGKYIDECRPWGKFQEAVLERTEEDVQVMHRQLGRKQSYRKMIREAREERAGKLGIVDADLLRRSSTPINAPPLEPPPEMYPDPPPEAETVNEYSEEEWALLAVNSL